MAAHKPVEWVQAVVNRFDEQVAGAAARRGGGPGLAGEQGRRWEDCGGPLPEVQGLCGPGAAGGEGASGGGGCPAPGGGGGGGERGLLPSPPRRRPC